MNLPPAVSGLYLSHPEAVYFAVGRIENDQVEDYARRKGWDIVTAKRWLGPILNLLRPFLTSTSTCDDSFPDAAAQRIVAGTYSDIDSAPCLR